MKKGYVILISVFVALATLSVGILSYWNGLRNTGIQKERALSAQYLDNQNYLSAFISGFYEQVNVAQTQSQILNQVLTDAVKGRYDNEQGGFTVNSAFFAAVREAYPEAGPQQLLENWAKIQDYIQGQRAGYRNVQSKLLDQLRDYDTWRETGLFKHLFVKMIGFPSGSLEARIGTKVYRKAAAREKMYQIVLTKDARKAYESGELEPLQVPSP